MRNANEAWLWMAGGVLLSAAVVYTVSERCYENGALEGVDKAYKKLGLQTEDALNIKAVKRYFFMDLPLDMQEDLMDSFPEKSFNAKDLVRVVVTK